MIQDQSESNSERGKDKNFYLSEEAGLTPLLAMTQSYSLLKTVIGWLSKKEVRALLRVGFIISLHCEITSVIFPVLPFSLSLSLARTYTHTHTRTHTHIIFFIFYLPCSHT